MLVWINFTGKKGAHEDQIKKQLLQLPFTHPFSEDRVETRGSYYIIFRDGNKSVNKINELNVLGEWLYKKNAWRFI